jgi:cell fate regulator YaaT (PSP1 superfamily)
MASHHLVRVGALGAIGRFTSVDATVYPRYTPVIVRTGRGLEVGEVLAPPDESNDVAAGDGSLLRRLTVEDQLLLARLQRNRDEALAACTDRLREAGLNTTLMDVEQLFDGRTLAFYFLGEITPEVEAITEELAELYEAQVQVRKFADTLTMGCGPGCGTEEAAGCKTCATGCAVAGLCATSRH